MPETTPKRPVILASSSPYRRLLLQRLGLPFETASPGIDESARPGEAPEPLTARLAAEKARAIAERFPDAVVIGSDQVAAHGDRIIGKPGSAERARAQLATFSGQHIVFLTALSVQCLATGFRFDATVGTDVVFRELTADEISRYVERDQPLDCAGAFKSEEGGPALLRSMSSSDPTAIIGLPLIALAGALRAAGFPVP